MLSESRVVIVVLVQFLVAMTVSSFVRAEFVPAELLEELNAWIDQVTDLPAEKIPARIVFANADEIEGPTQMASMIGKSPRGIYNPDNNTITLVRPWQAGDPQDVAVLLHELLHHRQQARHFFCEAAKEESAYRLQRRWLESQGLSLDVNWMVVVLASSCASRDFHPD